MDSYITALSTQSYVRANSRFIAVAGLNTAVYIEILCTILTSVDLKNKYDPETGFWKLNRDFVRNRTGILPADQRFCDQALVKLGIIVVDPDDSDKIKVDTKRYLSYLVATEIPEELTVPEYMKRTRAENQQAKLATLIERYTDLFGYEDEESRSIIKKLVEVYYKMGYTKKAQWEPIVPIVRSCVADYTALEELVNAIIASNYRSIPTAIDVFMKKHKPTGTKLNAEQKVCTDIMEEHLF